MASFEVRVCGGVFGAAIMTPLAGGVGALAGYVYAKLADLPVGQAVKAWAILIAAECAFINLVETLAENRSTQALIKAAVLTVTSFIGTQEMQKRGVMGGNMAIAWTIFNALALIGFLAEAAWPATVQAADDNPTEG